MRQPAKNPFVLPGVTGRFIRSHKQALVTLVCAFVVLISCASSRADVPPTDWCALVRQQDTWTKTPALDKKTEVFCHFFGLGKFKVLVKNGDHTSTYTLEAVADYIPVTFARLIGTGQSEIMIQSVQDARYPKPTFTGLIAIADAAYKPDPLDLKYPLFARFRNVSDEDAIVEATGVSQSEFVGSYVLGRISAQGFGAPGVLKAHETSSLVSLSKNLTARTVVWFTLINGTANTAVDLDFFSDPAGTKLVRTLRFRGNAVTNQLLLLYPQADNTLKVSTPGDIMRDGLALLDEAAAKDPSFRRPVPKKAYVSTAVNDSNEDMETYLNELTLVRRTGSNSAANNLGRMNDRREELGYAYGWDMAINFIPVPPDYKFDAKAAAAFASGAHSSGKVPRKTVIMLTDEPQYVDLPKNAALDARLRAWMQTKGMTPADVGCNNWDEVKVISATKANRKLSVVSRAFQSDQYVECYSGFAKAYSDISPNFLPAVNWGMLEYMDGIRFDIWEMYKRPGYGAVWAEDWYGYEPENAGAIAWYSDLMRSQQKYRSLPQGTYPIVGWGYGPTLTSMKYYERMMRGCYMFETYAYSPRGNQVAWIEQPRMVLNLARLHRDLAAVEDVLVGGTVAPAKVALLYPNSSVLWDEFTARDAQALYTAYMQANIPIDIITEQDVVDGYLKNYSMVLAVGRDIRTDAMKILDTYIRTGGTVVWSGREVCDQYDEPYPNGPLIVGAKGLVSQVDGPPGRWLYELPNAKPIDTVSWDGKQIPVYVKKSKIEPQAQATVLATFADGSPAITKTARGKGTVYLYAFSPGLSYMKADYNGSNTVLATVLCANDDQRALCTMPAQSIPNNIKVSAQMISTRAVTNGNNAVVGLVDYGVGEIGRKTKNLDPDKIELEKMDPYPVTLSIACAPKPTKVYGVRCGAVTSTYANGVLQVQVPLRGVDMIVLNGTQLAK